MVVPTHLYTTLFAIIGTVSLSVGLMRAAMAINDVSRKLGWKIHPDIPHDAYILWIQRGVRDGEAKFMAVEATPQDHPDRAGWLSDLGNCLGIRFERTGSMDGLNRAVKVTDIAVDATPQDR